MGAPTDPVIRFGRYTLHATEGLTCGSREIRVTRKALSVLWLLAQNAGRLVTKDQLFADVWPDVAVSDAALTSCVRELRRALKDDARAPRFIETRHRAGFRFLPPTRPEAAGDARPPAAAASGEACVGRHDALEQLADALGRARAGTRQLAVVHGEPGIGKTTLLEAFLGVAGETVARDAAPVLIAAGACVEEVGVGEPYRPLLDAVTRLCRLKGGERATLLRQYAPTWLAELPGLQTPAEARAFAGRRAGATRERMARELTDYLEALAVEQTLVVAIDDLHLADDSTLDWLAAFAARPDSARILLIVTLRTERHTRAHALCTAMGVRPWCRLVALTGLDEAATRELVRQRSGDRDREAADRLATRVHRLTDGHPLFIVALVPELMAAGSALAAGTAPVPARLGALIDGQIGRLEPAAIELLEAASLVADAEWSAAIVAAAVAAPLPAVERTLAGLAAREVFVRSAGVATWPDGTVAEQFAFRHALHRDALRARLPAGQRAGMHQRIGARMEAAFAGSAARVALPLAVHFEAAGDIDRAVRYLAEAAGAASRIGAAEEACRHAVRAVALLDALPPSADRDEREIALQMLLGGTVMTAQGWGAEAAERAYRRASDLCERQASTPQLFPTYWGLWLFRWGRGELAAARDLAGTLDRLGHRSPDPMLRLQVDHAQWATAFCEGRFDLAIRHAARGSALYGSCGAGIVGGAMLQYGNHDAGVCAGAFAGRALAVADRGAEARAAADAAVQAARHTDHAFSLVLALTFSAATYQMLGEPEVVAARAAEADEVSGRYGFRLMSAWARALGGWALSESGAPARGVEVVGEAVASAFATGSGQFRSYFLALLAETCLRAGQRERGLTVLDEAFAWTRHAGERCHEAELHRLRGQLLLLEPSAAAVAADALAASVAVARTQEAHLFARRSADALATLVT